MTSEMEGLIELIVISPPRSSDPVLWVTEVSVNKVHEQIQLPRSDLTAN